MVLTCSDFATDQYMQLSTFNSLLNKIMTYIVERIHLLASLKTVKEGQSLEQSPVLLLLIVNLKDFF